MFVYFDKKGIVKMTSDSAMFKNGKLKRKKVPVDKEAEIKEWISSGKKILVKGTKIVCKESPYNIKSIIENAKTIEDLKNILFIITDQ